MEILSMEFWTSLMLIVGLDLILAGDNAIVIALASRKLPKKQQRKAILWGSAGAVGIRAVLTLIVVWLLNIPFLHLAGGVMLLWIAYKLLVDQNKHEEVKEGGSLMSVIRTIIIADALMGLDNVLAIAGASHGSYLMVILGLIISIPIVMWGSTLFIKLVDRYSWIIYAGSAILALTAAKMMMSERLIEEKLADFELIKWLIMAILVTGVLLIGRSMNLKKTRSEPVVNN